jgi:GDP-L-fucose synthase
MIKKNVFVAGHNGMVGSALIRHIEKYSENNILTVDRKELDLTNQKQVDQYFKSHSIDEVYLAAAKVGGIYANNKYPANFIYENLMIEANVINASYNTGVSKLLLLGSSCIYPKYAVQPMKENALLTGVLEPTNEPYAIAKIAGIKMCESYNRQFGTDYRSVMPTNLYGPGDNFDTLNSHVIPALISKIDSAYQRGEKSIDVWGTGNAKREFLHVDDLAEASTYIMNLEKKDINAVTSESCTHINIGSGIEVSISELVEIICEIIEFQGQVKWDPSKPDGSPRKLMDSSILHSLGWKSKITLEQGLRETYSWYKNQKLYNNSLIGKV